MKRYLVMSYKLTPPLPTFLEARDALLMAAYANDPAHYRIFASAFARRVAIGDFEADAPNRESTPTDTGTSTSFRAQGRGLRAAEMARRPGLPVTTPEWWTMEGGPTPRDLPITCWTA